MYERGGGLGGLLIRFPALAVVTVFVGVMAFLGSISGQINHVDSLLTFAFVTNDERVYTEAYPILAQNGDYIGSVYIRPGQVGQTGMLKQQQLNDLLVQGWEVGTFIPQDLTAANGQAPLLIDQAKQQTTNTLGLEPLSLVISTSYTNLLPATVSAIQQMYNALLPRVAGISNAYNTTPIEKHNLKYVDGDQLSASQIEASLRKAREASAWIIIEFQQVGPQANQKLREIIPIAKALGFQKFALEQR